MLKLIWAYNTEQKMKFSIMDFFSKCNQIRRKLHFLGIVMLTLPYSGRNHFPEIILKF